MHLNLNIRHHLGKTKGWPKENEYLLYEAARAPTREKFEAAM